MKNFFYVNISHEVTLEEVRKALLSKILLILNILGIPVVLFGAYEAYTLEQYYTAISYFIIYSPITLTAIFQNKLPYKLVALVTISLALLLAILNIIVYGFGGAGIPIIFVALVLATLFFDIKAGFYVLIISMLAMSIFAYLYVQKIISLGVSLDSISTNTISWITSIAVVGLLGSTIALSLGIIQQKMIQGLKLSQQKTQELRKINLLLKEDVKKRKIIESELLKMKSNLEKTVEIRTEELQIKNKILSDNNSELERMNQIFVDREIRIKDLRTELGKLKK